MTKEYTVNEIKHLIRRLKNQSSPTIELEICNTKLRHVIDTGTTLNIISSAAYESIENRPKLNPSWIKAYGFNSNDPVPIKGEFITTINFNNDTHLAKYLVLNGEADNLLGFPAAKALGIIKLHESINRLIKASFRDLMIQRYKSVFENRIGKMKGVAVMIKTDPNIRPIQQPPHKIPFHLRPFVKLKLESLKAQNIIVEVLPGERVTWVSPIRAVGKFDPITKELVDVRCTGNYIQVNRAIIPVKRHMPSVIEMTQDLEHMEWFSLVDVREAFLQTGLHEDCQHLTVFGEGDRLWKYTRMNMGLSVASEIFQELMTNMMRGIPHTKIATDDILTCGKTEQDCKLNTDEVLRRIAKAEMTVKLEKCEFVVPEIKFYGLIISKHGIKPTDSKMSDFMDTCEPKSAKDAHSFLGVVAHFANRIPYSALIAKPMRELLKKGRKFIMEDRHKESFRKLKEAIILTCVCYFNSKWHSFLFVDAGPEGCAAILTQENPEDHEDIRLIDCGSHCFTDAEYNYSHLEKEAYGVVWGTEHNHVYLYGSKFTILTDSLSVQKIFEEERPRKTIPLRLQRLKSRLQLYGGAKVKHISGKENIADFLSRHMPIRKDRLENNIETDFHIHQLIEDDDTNNAIRAIVESDLFDGITIEQIINETDKDEDLKTLKACIIGRKKINQFKHLKHYGSIMEELWISNDGIIMKDNNIVLPTSLQERAIKYAHQGHMGIVLCKRLLKTRVWFKGMDTRMESEIRDCLPCQANTDNTNHAPMIISEIPRQNSSLVSLDFSSMTPSNEYLLVANYERARFPAYSITKHITGADAVTHARRMFEKFGFPEAVKTDNGPAFRAEVFKEFLFKLKIKHLKITPLNPEANGGCERLMRPINKCIRCAAVEGKSWKPVVKDWIEHYRATPHTSTGIAPEVAMGVKSAFNIPNRAKAMSEMEINDTMKQNDSIARDTQKYYADLAQSAKKETFAPGDHVLYKWTKTNKHHPVFDPNPYTIEKVKGNTIEAARMEQTPTYLCRNCRLFKKISKECFSQATGSKSHSSISKPLPGALTETIITRNNNDAEIEDDERHVPRPRGRPPGHSEAPAPQVHPDPDRYPKREPHKPDRFHF
jgi:hypothetical protein